MIIYLVYKDSDETEGKGSFRLIEAFLHEQHARRWIEAQPDPWDRKNREWTSVVPGLHSFGHMYYTELHVHEEDISGIERVREEIAQGVLARLAPEERDALVQYIQDTMS